MADGCAVVGWSIGLRDEWDEGWGEDRKGRDME